MGSISRLESSEDAYKVAEDVYRVILRNLDVVKTEETEKSDEEQSLENFKDALDNMGSETSENMGGTESGGSGSDEGFDSSTNDDGSEAQELTDRQKELLKKHLQKQNNFMDGDIQKTKASKKLQNDVEAINSSGATYENVGSDISQNHWDTTKIGGT